MDRTQFPWHTHRLRMERRIPSKCSTLRIYKVKCILVWNDEHISTRSRWTSNTGRMDSPIIRTTLSPALKLGWVPGKTANHGGTCIVKSSIIGSVRLLQVTPVCATQGPLSFCWNLKVDRQHRDDATTQHKADLLLTIQCCLCFCFCSKDKLQNRLQALKPLVGSRSIFQFIMKRDHMGVLSLRTAGT